MNQLPRPLLKIMEESQLYINFDKDLYRLSAEKVEYPYDVDPDRIISGSAVSTVSQALGLVYSGKTGFSNDETGYILGNDEGVQKFFIGTAADYFNFDGTNVTISGTLSAGAIDIGGADATSFHVDSTGNMWLGAGVIGSAVAKILNTGEATFTKATISGGANVIFTSDTLDTSSKKILKDFNFGTADYAGAVKAGDVTWNTTTGAITGGSGVVVYRSGIVGAKAGVTTFSIDAATGDATFAGTLSAAAGTLGTITAGTFNGVTITGGTIQTAASGERIVISGTNKDIKFYDSGSVERLQIGGSNVVYFRDQNGDYDGLIQAITDTMRIVADKNISLEAGTGGVIEINKNIVPDGTCSLGTSSDKMFTCHFSSYIYSWGCVQPNTDPSYSSLGEQTRYWQYLWVNYLRYKDIDTFQTHDDIALIKNIGTKEVTRVQVEGYDDTKIPPVPIKKYETVHVLDPDTMPEEVKFGEFCDAGALQGLIIGTLKQLITKVEELESKI